MPGVREGVLAVIEDVARRPVAIEGGASLFDAAILDSFALPELVTALETRFGITIPDADLSARTFETLDRIVAYVESKR